MERKVYVVKFCEKEQIDMSDVFTVKQAEQWIWVDSAEA